MRPFRETMYLVPLAPEFAVGNDESGGGAGLDEHRVDGRAVADAGGQRVGAKADRAVASLLYLIVSQVMNSST